MEAAGSSEKIVSIHETTQHHIPEDLNLMLDCFQVTLEFKRFL
jgi:hypothetical protein